MASKEMLSMVNRLKRKSGKTKAKRVVANRRTSQKGRLTKRKIGSGTATDPFRTYKDVEKKTNRPLVKKHKKRVTPKKHTKKARRIRRSLTYKT